MPSVWQKNENKNKIRSCSCQRNEENSAVKLNLKRNTIWRAICHAQTILCIAGRSVAQIHHWHTEMSLSVRINIKS